MPSFGHGGNGKEISRKMGINYENIVDFSANINPLGMPKSVKDAIINEIDQVEKYPDITYFELKQSISKFENIKEENIILGNGAAEVLFNIVRGINPKKVLILAPTFLEYEEATKSINGKIYYYILKESNDFKIQEDILDYIDEELDLIFICNPNNPTGVITSKELLLKILNKSKANNVNLLIDESFLDFIDENLSMIPYVDEYKNLIIIKSLTKLFALPGIRIGYGLLSNEILKDRINKIIPAWNINILAEIATKQALIDKSFIDKSIKFIHDEKEYLIKELRLIKNIHTYKSSVNFIFLKVINKINLKEELLRRNILIRSCSNYVGLDENYYRLAVRTRKENSDLVKALKEIFK